MGGGGWRRRMPGNRVATRVRAAIGACGDAARPAADADHGGASAKPSQLDENSDWGRGGGPLIGFRCAGALAAFAFRF